MHGSSRTKNQTLGLEECKIKEKLTACTLYTVHCPSGASPQPLNALECQMTMTGSVKMTVKEGKLVLHSDRLPRLSVRFTGLRHVADRA